MLNYEELKVFIASKLVFSAMILTFLVVTSRSILAAEFNDGDACAVSGAYHIKNTTEGAAHLICNGTTWEQVLFIDKDDLVSAPSYCDSTGANCFDATYVQNGLIRPVASAAAPLFSNDLNDLDNVTTSSATNGQCIVYNSGSGEWEANTCAGTTATSIEVVATAASPIFSNDLDDIEDVSVSGASNGECLVYNSGSGDWETGACGSGSTTAIENVASAASPVFNNDITNLDDVDTSGVAGGECLVYNSGAGLWNADTCATGTTTTIESVVGAASPAYDNQITGLDDVNTLGVNVNDVLIWNGTNWVPNTTNISDLSDVDTAGTSINDFLIWNGTNWVPNTTDISDLDDVNTASANVNDILTWNGTNWVPNTGLPSDRRLKKNIASLETDIAEKILSVQSVSYEMIKGSGRTEYGVIAQDIEKTFPNLVGTNQDEMKSVNYIGLIAPMILTIQNLAEKNKSLEKRIEALEKKIGEK